MKVDGFQQAGNRFRHPYQYLVTNSRSAGASGPPLASTAIPIWDITVILRWVLHQRIKSLSDRLALSCQSLFGRSPGQYDQLWFLPGFLLRFHPASH